MPLFAAIGVFVRHIYVVAFLWNFRFVMLFFDKSLNQPAAW